MPKKKVIGFALILLSFVLLATLGGQHTGSVEWGYRILYGIPGLVGVLLVTVQRLRWMVAILLCLAITNSYMDRNTLGLAVTAIRDSGDIPISDGDFANLVSVFLFAYALMYVGGGKLMDALGTRRGFFWVTIFWSFAVISHGFAGGIAALLVSRLLLGIGEGGAPAITKAVAEWFPARERSTAMGLINAGTAFGGMVAPPLVAVVLRYHFWPGLRNAGTFPLAMGLLPSGALASSGASCGVDCTTRPPNTHGYLPLNARKSTISSRPGRIHWLPKAPSIPWLRLFTYRAVWGLMLCKFLGDAVWYFIAFWLPKYLIDVRGYDIAGWPRSCGCPGPVPASVAWSSDTSRAG